MRRLLLIILLLTLPGAFADSLFQHEQVTSEISISGSAKVKPQARIDDLEYATINLSFFPQSNFQQQVSKSTITPQTPILNSIASFTWDKPNKPSLDFAIISTVITKPEIIKVSKKIPFPIQNIPDSAKLFLKSSETIDADDPDIVALANELAAGKDDLYEVVFTLSKWSKENIEYDLSTLTESVSQKASWVLENKKGVCDELTNLFIAMNRALGIPAKFISGVAYTDSVPTEDGFGAHGWAEVYFPGHGWIPFDVTYGEYGYLDEFHIKLKESVDAIDPSTRYQWLGRDITLATSPLKINTKIKERIRKKKELVELKVIPEKSKVGFGSYNVIQVTVENLQDFYLATEVSISKSEEITMLESNKKAILLKPGEIKQLFWLVQVDEFLQPGFIYTFPMVAATTRNTTYASKFEVQQDSVKLTKQQAQRIINDAAKEEEKTLSREISINCTPATTSFYTRSNVEINCNVKNDGNAPLDNLNVCMDTTCKTINVPISKSIPTTFMFTSAIAGVQEVVMTASNAHIFKRTALDLEVLDAPVITIKDIELPAQVGYEDEFKITFTLEKTSMSKPQNVLIQILPLKHEWTLDQLQQDRRFTLLLKGKHLKAGANTLNLQATYNDFNDMQFQSQNSATITLAGTSVWQRVKLFFSGLFR
ncbi:MAG: transglutaminase-like domain-containing protein [Nanoarchaeota archaeon]|nr:transglutaminase-like domain-containing protein [Nanoarchaeota archaeon]